MNKKRFTHQRTDDYNFSDILDNGKWIGICHVDCEDDFVNKFNELAEENEQLKQELKVYRKVASCSNCKYHNYDWNIDDGYGGEEYEVCDKGNDVTDGICEEWEEL